MWVPYHHLGREVFIVPVHWGEDGWFQAGVNGIVPQIIEMDLETSDHSNPSNYNASFEILREDKYRWCYLRDPKLNNYRFTDQGLRLQGTPVTLDNIASPTFIGIRQSEFNTNLSVNVVCDTGEAGVTFFMDESHHYDLAVKDVNNVKEIILRLCIGDVKAVVQQVSIPEATANICLKVVSDPINYHFYCLLDGQDTYLGKAQAKYLSSEVAGGFTGTIMAMYAVSSEEARDHWAEFKDLFWEQKS